jgi:hypothetical protein
LKPQPDEHFLAGGKGSSQSENIRFGSGQTTTSAAARTAFANSSAPTIN